MAEEYIVYVYAAFDSNKEKERVLSRLKEEFIHEKPVDEGELNFSIELYADNWYINDKVLPEYVKGFFNNDKVAEAHIDISRYIESDHIGG